MTDGKIEDERLRETLRRAKNNVTNLFRPEDYIAVCEELLARRALEPQEGRETQVKALDWTQLTSPREDGPPEPIAEWEASSVVGIYIIEDDGNEWWLKLATIEDVHQIGRSSDPETLRPVAQADYEDRIRSCLASPPQQATAGEVVDDLPPGEFWMFYDHQTGRWCVYDDGPPKVIRTGAEVIHVREVRAANPVDDEAVERGAIAIDALWSEGQDRGPAFHETEREYQQHCRSTARAALLAAQGGE